MVHIWPFIISKANCVNLCIIYIALRRGKICHLAKSYNTLIPNGLLICLTITWMLLVQQKYNIMELVHWLYLFLMVCYFAWQINECCYFNRNNINVNVTRIALLPAFGLSGSAEIVTKEGLNLTCSFNPDCRGDAVAGLVASHLKIKCRFFLLCYVVWRFIWFYWRVFWALFMVNLQA